MRIYLVFLPIFTRCHTRIFSEQPAEIQRIVITDSGCYFSYIFITVFKVSLCSSDSQRNDVLHRRYLHNIFKAVNKPVDTHKFSSAIDIEVNEHTGEITSIKADGKEILRTPMHFNIIRFTDNDRDLVPHWIGRCHLDACKYMAVKDLFKVTAEQPFSFSVNPYTTKQLCETLHSFELEENDFVNVCIDLAMRGVGSHSCGPELPDEYEIPRKGKNTFKFTF